MLPTGHKGSNVREIPPQLLITLLANHFQQTQILVMPSWADLVKTGCFKQMPPNFAGWWYTRAAAIARQIYLHPSTSVESLRNRFGQNQHVGPTPNHHCKCSGKVIRIICQQLEKIEWVKLGDNGGRIMTSKGQHQLDLIAQEAMKYISK